MTVSYNWLKDYIKCSLSPEEVAAALTSIGLEVDSVETVEEIPGGLAGVVVAEVVECVEHPDSDHLHITKVNAGGPELLQVVCGAPNVAAGEKVLLATIGTVLGEDFKIKKSKIRGVESFGMLCAEDELGIGESHDGIMILDPAAVPGTPAKDYLHLATDTIIEIGLTANRVDAASHIGVARDLYAYLKHNNIPCELCIPDVSAFTEPASDEGSIPVEVIAKTDAPRYFGATLRGAKVGPSPEWLQKKLLSVGLRPIDNVVDVSNFVLMELGQPLHTFDAAKISGDRVIVRDAYEGEKLVTLDGVERELNPADLVIADDKSAMCLAGVFGGADSGISENTKDIFLEIAYFNPVTIRKTSKRHGLKTDASFRYERGCDPLALEYAAKRAILLLQELTGARLDGKIRRVESAQFARRQVELDYNRIENFIGKKIGHGTIEEILTALGYEFIGKREDGAVVGVPTYMVDVYRECDVVEEILRVYGYNNVELPKAMRMSVNPSEKPEPEIVRNTISDWLAANGFVETMNNSLTKGEYYSKLTTFPEERCVRVLNPLSSDLNVMRQTLIINGLEVIAYNINRQATNLRTFEYGSVYSLKNVTSEPRLDDIDEHQCYAMFISGAPEKSWRTDSGKGSFFQLKGYVEALLKRLGVDLYQMETAEAPADIFSDGQTYLLPGSHRQLAVLGVIAQPLLRKFGIRQPVFAAEINWQVLFELVKRDKISYRELPKYPEVRRDLALLLDENVSFADLRRTAYRAGKKILKSVSLFDVYKGDKIPQGKKQYALSFVLQDIDKTLTDADVERIMQKLLSSFRNENGATLR